uniref:AlNc14C45G3657 protein n=1 Tax=Albugo laibachii Nc14 TaxID=890382 RepID=F0WAC7_9STRA|nr:AlNc14C45G3657 [Albugo laibachii Nc14]|eukprot:CCA18098.1 AlNc14C45G3657 [Albugo laibachii Nc14]
MYPGQQVALVTSVGQAPNPPSGFVPHRAGQGLIEKQKTIPCDSAREIISLDTIDWPEHHLEQRLLQLIGWMAKPTTSNQKKLRSLNKVLRGHGIR